MINQAASSLHLPTVQALVPSQLVIREEIESGATTGLFGFLAIMNIPMMVEKIKIYSKIDFSEGFGSALMDMFQAPLKIIICVISAIKTLNYLPFIAIPTMVVTTPIFILASALYLFIEFIRTILSLVHTCQFGKRENIDLLLKNLETLTTEATKIETSLTPFLELNKNALILQIGEIEFANLLNSLTTVKPLALERIKAILTMQKVQKVYTTYVKGEGADGFLGKIRANVENPSDHKYMRCFQRRIGELAAKEFAHDARHIETYTIPKLNTLDIDSLKNFTEKTSQLLKMVNTQHKKVLKVHILSIVVLTLAALAIIGGFIFTSPALFLISMALTVVATIFSLVRTVANDAYINNTGAGFNARLMIPVDLAAKEGESNSNSWRTSNAAARVGFVITNIFLLCIPLIYDRIAKAAWLTRLRNGQSTTALADGNNFANIASRFKTEEMTIAKYEAPVNVLAEDPTPPDISPRETEEMTIATDAAPVNGLAKEPTAPDTSPRETEEFDDEPFFEMDEDY